MAAVFDALGIDYYLCGSLASSIHGEPRATRDVNFVALIEPEHAEPLVAALGEAFYADAGSIRDAARRHRHFNVVLLATMMKVDVFVPADRTRFREEHRRSVPSDAGGRVIRVASAEDTVLAKLDWYRLGGETSDRQWSDVVGVLRVQWGTLDLDYLTREAARHRLDGPLQRALAAVP